MGRIRRRRGGGAADVAGAAAGRPSRSCVRRVRGRDRFWKLCGLRRSARVRRKALRRTCRVDIGMRHWARYCIGGCPTMAVNRSANAERDMPRRRRGLLEWSTGWAGSASEQAEAAADELARRPRASRAVPAGASRIAPEHLDEHESRQAASGRSPRRPWRATPRPPAARTTGAIRGRDGQREPRGSVDSRGLNGRDHSRGIRRRMWAATSRPRDYHRLRIAPGDRRHALQLRIARHHVRVAVGNTMTSPGSSATGSSPISPP